MNEILALTERLTGPDFRLQAHHAAWTTQYYSGDVSAAAEHAQQGIELYDIARHRSHAFLYGGHDPGVCCRDSLALCLWLLGQPDQAITTARDAVALAQQLEHPFSSALALDCITAIHQFRSEAGPALKHADAMITLCTEENVTQYLPTGTMFRGWALTAEGQARTGIQTLLQGLEATKTIGSNRHLPFCFYLLADAYHKAGQVSEGLQALDDALEWIRRTGEQRWESVVRRLKGELLLRQSVNDLEAEAFFREALELARRQQVKSLELRATTSLSRLWQAQGKRNQARDLLAPVYDWFTEGFDTADLKDAKAVLESIR